MYLQDFSTKLHAFCDEVTSHFEKNHEKSLSQHLAASHLSQYSGVTFHLSGSSLIGASNHKKLVTESFNRKQIKAMTEIYDTLKQAVPAVDHPTNDFDLLVYPARRQHRISFSICGVRLGGSSGQMFSTVLNKLETAAGHLQDVPKPGSRTFKVQDTVIPAVDMYAAYRVWAALSSPDLFTKPANTAVLVHEQFSEAQCLAAQNALLPQPQEA
jgi:hypothetical protein